LRILYPGAVYHVMNRGLARGAAFLGEADHARFVELLDDLAHRWRVRIYAYCCMTTHFHLLLQTPDPNLPRIMRHLGGLYTQRLNRAYHRDGPLFRGRYKAILVQAETYLLQVVRYVHLNPVAAGLTHDPGAYPWSSHRLYRQVTPPEWLARDEVMAPFPDLPSFEQFVAEGNDDSLEAFYASRRWRSILGDDAFTAWVLAAAHRSREHSRAERTPQFPSVEAVMAAIGAQMGALPDAFLASRRGSSNLPRDLAIYVASRIAGFPHAAVKRCFGIGSDSAVTRTCDRTVRRLRTMPYLRHVLRSFVP
jgi:REP element-mobilizing transposase RayT